MAPGRLILATRTRDEAVEQTRRLASGSLCVASFMPRAECGPCRVDVLEARPTKGWAPTARRRLLVALELCGWWVARGGPEETPGRESFHVRDARSRETVLTVSLPVGRPVEPLVLRRLGRATGLRPADLRSPSVDATLRAAEAALRKHRPVARRIAALQSTRLPITALVQDVGGGPEGIRIAVASLRRGYLGASHMLLFREGQWHIYTYGDWTWSIPAGTDLVSLARTVFGRGGTRASLPPELVERFGLVLVDE